MAQQSGDQAAIKLVELLYLRDHGPEAGYPRIIAFLEAAPGWPLYETLMKRAEIALYENHEPANVVSAHFAGRKPATPQGALALARMAYAAGDQPQGKALLRQAWGDCDVDSNSRRQDHCGIRFSPYR